MAYNKAHIAYCSNVHPGDSLTKVCSNIVEHFSVVRESRELSHMASGLWLSAKAANQLITEPTQLTDFKKLLKEQGMHLTSLNGFPYGNFHLSQVKQKVYSPTWAQPERLAYSQQLAEILAECLPDGTHTGAISTLPLGYANDWDDEHMEIAVEQFIVLAKHLKLLEKRSLKRILLCIEMEPDCALQSTNELTTFFVEHLLPKAQEQGIANADILRYIGCCYDTCHQGVMNEDITESLMAIKEAGIEVGKIQISNAIHAELNTTNDVKELTTIFQDEKFLHQTKVFKNNALISALPDLNHPELLALFNMNQPPITAKIHYHIPINQSALPRNFLSSTQAAIHETLNFIKNTENFNPILEIETYTWLNLIKNNSDNNTTLHQGLTAEFTWLEHALAERNLLHNSL